MNRWILATALKRLMHPTCRIKTYKRKKKKKKQWDMFHHVLTTSILLNNNNKKKSYLDSLC